MSFLSTFLHHPRKLWLRRALFQIHLWAGVLLAVYVMIIALTGSVLVFRAELRRAQLPKDLNSYNALQQATIESVVQHFRTTYPGATLQNLQTPSPRIPAFLLSGTSTQHQPLILIADPVTGSFYPQTQSWLDWVYDLHVYLLLGHAYGMQVNGIGAATLLILTLSGLYLWWPGVKTWVRGLSIDLRRNWRRINFDAHNAIGFWTMLIVFWWAFSGVYFAWYRQVTSVVAILSPLHGMLSPKLADPTTPGIHHVTLQQILSAIHQASPDGQLFSLSDPLLSGSMVYALVDLRTPGDFSHRDIITLSTADAHVLTIWHYGQNHSAGDWILWAMHPLHFGNLWGRAVEIIWALAGIALALLAMTGVLMYWNRFLRHRLVS
jgi:uncharacterized iron-regulated membrane protein